ncbi:MAG: hypothetical protein IIA54_02450 [Chloroflexi bacterium]|nr:hypothetical protein [Chloroflexota bacterium]
MMNSDRNSDDLLRLMRAIAAAAHDQVRAAREEMSAYSDSVLRIGAEAERSAHEAAARVIALSRDLDTLLARMDRLETELEATRAQYEATANPARQMLTVSQNSVSTHAPEAPPKTGMVRRIRAWLPTMQRIPRVLFICTANAGRSQMSQAYVRFRYAGHFRADSAGVTPATRVNPVVERFLRGLGLDRHLTPPRLVTVSMLKRATVVLECDDTVARTMVASLVDKFASHDWSDLPDPAGKSFDEVASIFETISRRIDTELVPQLRVE